MVTKSVSFLSSIDALMETYAQYLCIYSRKKWWSVHPLGTADHAGECLLGAYSASWLPAPDISTIAAIADLVEEHVSDPEVLSGMAAILQRAAAMDRSIRLDVNNLASKVRDLFQVRPPAGVALQVSQDLEKLLVAPDDWCSLETVLGQGHSHPELLLELARIQLVCCEGTWCDVLTVIHRLRGVAATLQSDDPTKTAADMESWFRRQVDLDLAALSVWIDIAGLDVDEVDAVFEWLKRLNEEDLQ